MARKPLVSSSFLLFIVVLAFSSSIPPIEARDVSSISVTNDEYYGGSASGSGNVPSEWLEEYYEGNLLYSTTMPQDSTLLASGKCSSCSCPFLLLLLVLPLPLSLLVFIIPSSLLFLLPTVGNGYISTVIFSPSQFLAGVFNGPQISQTAPSHRAAIPSTTTVLLSNESVILDALALDLLSGIFKLRASLPTSSSPIQIEQRWYAHQVLRSILILEIEVHNPTSSEVTVGLTWSFNASSSSDINFQELSTLNDTIRRMQGYINVPENGTIVEVAVVFSNIPETLT
jgi:hypothetical protein